MFMWSSVKSLNKICTRSTCQCYLYAAFFDSFIVVGGCCLVTGGPIDIDNNILNISININTFQFSTSNRGPLKHHLAAKGYPGFVMVFNTYNISGDTVPGEVWINIIFEDIYQIYIFI